MFDTAMFLAKAPEDLREAQILLEKAAKAFAMASDQEAELTREYREKKAQCTRENMKSGTPATVTAEIVRGDTASEKAALMKVQGQKKKALLMYDAMKERIYNIRHLSKGIDLGNS